MGGPDPLRIEIRHAPDRVILVLDGELDMATVPSLQQTIEGGELDAEAMVVFDLRQLEFMDSTGLRIILSMRERCEGRGQQFAVTPGSEQVQRLLSITGAAEHLRSIAAVDEMVA
jgi:anti-sigma B factor antagonist